MHCKICVIWPCNAHHREMVHISSWVVWWFWFLHPKKLSPHLFQNKLVFLVKSLFVNPPNSIRLSTIIEVIVFDVLPSTIFSKLSNIGALFHASTTYKCIDNQNWLSMVVISFVLIDMKSPLWTTTLMAWRTI